MTTAEFHAFLRLELPCRESDLVDRLGLLHRAMPKSYLGWPKTLEEVAAVMQVLAADGLAERRGFEWWWIGKRAGQEKPEAQKSLFA